MIPGFFYCLPIASHDSAHRAQASAHERIVSSSPKARQDSSQVRQMSAQTVQTSRCERDIRPMKSAFVRHICAQSRREPMCDASACFPPI